MEPLSPEGADYADRVLLDRIERAHRDRRPVRISGQPMIRYGADQEDTFYNDCDIIKDVVCSIRRISRNYHISPELNGHLGGRFVGEFAVAFAVDLETQDEYMLGLRSLELGLSVQEVDQPH